MLSACSINCEVREDAPLPERERKGQLAGEVKEIRSSEYKVTGQREIKSASQVKPVFVSLSLERGRKKKRPGSRTLAKLTRSK